MFNQIISARGARVLQLGGAAMAIAAVALVGTGSGVGASSGPTASILTPAAGFADGAVLTITGSGWAPGVGINILECAAPGGNPPADPTAAGVCDGNSIQNDSIIANSSGAFSYAAYSLSRLPSSNLGETAASLPVCDATHDCVLYIGTDQTNPSAPHVYAPPGGFAVSGGSAPTTTTSTSTSTSSSSSSSTSTSTSTSSTTSSSSTSSSSTSSSTSTSAPSSSSTSSTTSTSAPGGTALTPPRAPAGATASSSATSASATGTASTHVSGLSVSATGIGAFTLAAYSANPLPTAPSGSSGEYFDLKVAPGSSFSSLSLTDCSLNGGAGLEWWSPTSPLSPTTTTTAASGSTTSTTTTAGSTTSTTAGSGSTTSTTAGSGSTTSTTGASTTTSTAGSHLRAADATTSTTTTSTTSSSTTSSSTTSSTTSSSTTSTTPGSTPSTTAASSGAWSAVSPAAAVNASCAQTTLGWASSPSLAQLSGTVFAVVSQAGLAAASSAGAGAGAGTDSSSAGNTTTAASGSGSGAGAGGLAFTGPGALPWVFGLGVALMGLGTLSRRRLLAQEAAG